MQFILFSCFSSPQTIALSLAFTLVSSGRLVFNLLNIIAALILGLLVKNLWITYVFKHFGVDFLCNDNAVFNLLRKHQIVFPSGRTITHSEQQGTGASGFHFSVSSAMIVSISFCDISHPICLKLYLTMVWFAFP